MTKKILIVDDAHEVADCTAELLGLLGYEVRTAYDGQQAVNAIRDERPDVVLLDLNMPVLDGLEAARVIRDMDVCPPPTLVALSAQANLAGNASLREAGFTHAFTKPVDVDELCHLLDGPAP